MNKEIREKVFVTISRRGRERGRDVDVALILLLVLCSIQSFYQSKQDDQRHETQQYVTLFV